MTESEGVAEVCAVIYSHTDGGATRPFQLSVSTENNTTGCSYAHSFSLSYSIYFFVRICTWYTCMYIYMYHIVSLEDSTSDFISYFVLVVFRLLTQSIPVTILPHL